MIFIESVPVDRVKRQNTDELVVRNQRSRQAAVQPWPHVATGFAEIQNGIRIENSLKISCDPAA